MTNNKKSRISPFWKQCFVTSAVCSNIIGHGCCMGYPAVLLPQLHQPGAGISLTQDDDSWIGHRYLMSIAVLLSNFIMPPIMSRLGRKVAHYCVSAPAIAGWSAIVLADRVEVLIAGRVLQGLSVGMLLLLRSVLIGEYTSPKSRGAFLTTVSFAQAFGIFFVHLIGSLLSWQTTALISVSFALLSLIMTIYLPESPSWLAEKGRYEDCRQVFRWLRGDDEEDELEKMIEARLLLQKADIGSRNKSYLGGTIRKLGRREFVRPLAVMLCLYAMMHICGGTTMAAFSTQIISMIAGPEVNAHFWMITLDSARIVVNALAIYVINKFNRRTMTFAIGGLSALSHFAIAGFVYVRERGLLSPAPGPWLPLLLINVQFVCVAAGMVPLPSVLAGELFPLEYKSVGGGVSLAFSAAFMFLVLKSFLPLLEGLGVQGTYAVFGCGLCAGLVAVGALLPETRGNTLTQIEDELRAHRPQRAELAALRDHFVCRRLLEEDVLGHR